MLGIGAMVGGVGGLATFPVWDDEDLGTHLAAGAATGAVLGVIGGSWALTENRRSDYRLGFGTCMRERGFQVTGWE